jgi:hypothetical protein
VGFFFSLKVVEILENGKGQTLTIKGIRDFSNFYTDLFFNLILKPCIRFLLSYSYSGIYTPRIALNTEPNLTSKGHFNNSLTP